GFAVQVGSFASRASADRLAAELRGRRFETFVSPVRSSGRQLYRVRVGPVEDRAAAQALAVRLKSAGQSGSVVPLP
ncbi:MAG: SPOR domain-containing protein, partial [Gammaproteobacteria bacterium]|nr:SPOR domain-containing protein [Gammaproteobacteria bacterium]